MSKETPISLDRILMLGFKPADDDPECGLYSYELSGGKELVYGPHHDEESGIPWFVYGYMMGGLEEHDIKVSLNSMEEVEEFIKMRS